MADSDRANSSSSRQSSGCEMGGDPLVSLIVPIYKCARYLEESLECIQRQTYRPLQAVLYDDCSPDDSRLIVEKWLKQNSSREIDHREAILVESGTSEQITVKYVTIEADFTVIFASGGANHGPGYARNRAISLSSGVLLCHFDSDDLMRPQRLERQVQRWKSRGCPVDVMIGCDFDRYPADSTPYYTNWVNSLTDRDMYNQRFRECTIICPSWMYTRNQFNKIASYVATTNRHLSNSYDDESSTRTSSSSVTEFDRVRGFVESSEHSLATCKVKRIPEDLFFFLDHLLLGGSITKVPEVLLTYRYAEGSWALGTSKQDLAQVRVGYLEDWIHKNSSHAAIIESKSKRKKNGRHNGGVEAVHAKESGLLDAADGEITVSEHEMISIAAGTPDAVDSDITHNKLALTTIDDRSNSVGIVPRDWSQFSIWGYGKDGKKFISMLKPETAARVTNFIDVDMKKVNGLSYFCESIKKHVPIIHFSEAKPPFVVCVASKRAGDELEQNIRSVPGDLVEGVDYIHFN
jgi:glycosyltransferase involved in cell wall biosynthesis